MAERDGQDDGADKRDDDPKHDAKGSSGDGADDGDRSEDDDDSDDSDDDEDDGKPSLFRRPLFWIILIVVVAVLVIGGVLWWLHARQYESTDDAFVDAHVVRLAPEVGGRLVSVADVDNRHVEAGRLLAVIEPNGRDAQLGEARANVTQAEAQYRQSLAQVDAAQAAAA